MISFSTSLFIRFLSSCYQEGKPSSWMFVAVTVPPASHIVAHSAGPYKRLTDSWSTSLSKRKNTSQPHNRNVKFIMRYKYSKRKGRRSGVRVILIKKGRGLVTLTTCKRLATHYRLEETQFCLKTAAPGTVPGLHTEKRWKDLRADQKSHIYLDLADASTMSK